MPAVAPVQVAVTKKVLLGADLGEIVEPPTLANKLIADELKVVGNNKRNLSSISTDVLRDNDMAMQNLGTEGGSVRDESSLISSTNSNSSNEHIHSKIFFEISKRRYIL